MECTRRGSGSKRVMRIKVDAEEAKTKKQVKASADHLTSQAAKSTAKSTGVKSVNGQKPLKPTKSNAHQLDQHSSSTHSSSAPVPNNPTVNKNELKNTSAHPPDQSTDHNRPIEDASDLKKSSINLEIKEEVEPKIEQTKELKTESKTDSKTDSKAVSRTHLRRNSKDPNVISKPSITLEKEPGKINSKPTEKLAIRKDLLHVQKPTESVISIPGEESHEESTDELSDASDLMFDPDDKESCLTNAKPRTRRSRAKWLDESEDDGLEEEEEEDYNTADLFYDRSLHNGTFRTGTMQTEDKQQNDNTGDHIDKPKDPYKPARTLPRQRSSRGGIIEVFIVVIMAVIAMKFLVGVNKPNKQMLPSDRI